MKATPVLLPFSHRTPSWSCQLRKSYGRAEAFPAGLRPAFDVSTAWREERPKNSGVGSYSAVRATRNGQALTCSATKSTVATSLSGAGFVQVLLKRRMPPSPSILLAGLLP